MSQPIATEGRARVEESRGKHRTELFTLLFTDTVGSTALKQRLGGGDVILAGSPWQAGRAPSWEQP